MVKGNIYLGRQSLNHLVANFYSKAQLWIFKNKKWTKVPFRSRKDMLNQIKNFSFTIRITKGLATYEEIRHFFAVATRYNEYVIAGPAICLLEIRRVFGNAMN